MSLSRDQILGASDIQTEQVAVPEWGGHVFVRGLTGAERDEFEAGIVMLKKGQKDAELNLKNIRARLVALSVVDAAGQRLFKSADAEALGTKSAAALQRIYAVAQRLSGLTNEDMEELAQNLESGPSGDSPSG